MPRGSKPGTKRGGRKRGTPNRRTILADRIFVAAAAHPVAGWQELLSVLMDDQALPADTRLVIAQKPRSAPRGLIRLAPKQQMRNRPRRRAKNRPRSNSTRCFASHAMRASLRKSAAKRQRGWRRFSCPRPQPAIPRGRGRLPMNTGLSSARKSPANIATPNCCWRNSRTAMDRSDRGTLGKPRRFGHASRRYAEVSYLLRTRSTEGTDLTDAASLLTRTSFRRI